MQAKILPKANVSDYRISIDVFEGPLDLLLYLVKKEELNIYDIPITKITTAYIDYLQLMKNMNIEIAGEFILMAATLIRIKVRFLLPSSISDDDRDEEDPRGKLIRQLLEYRRFKQASAELEVIAQRRAKEFGRPDITYEEKKVEPLFELNLFELIEAFSSILAKKKDTFLEIIADEFNVQQKIKELNEIFSTHDMLNFLDIFYKAQTRLEAVTYFLAMLELVSIGALHIYQDRNFESIMIYKVTHDNDR